MSLSKSIPRLKFADKHIDRIRRGEKTATIRIGLDDSQTVTLEKPMKFIDSVGYVFGTAIVSKIAGTSVKVAASRDIDGHRSYDSTDELLGELRGYYPETEIDADTDVTIVYWKQFDDER